MSKIANNFGPVLKDYNLKWTWNTQINVNQKIDRHTTYFKHSTEIKHLNNQPF